MAASLPDKQLQFSKPRPSSKKRTSRPNSRPSSRPQSPRVLASLEESSNTNNTSTNSNTNTNTNTTSENNFLFNNKDSNNLSEKRASGKRNSSPQSKPPPPPPRQPSQKINLPPPTTPPTHNNNTQTQATSGLPPVPKAAPPKADSIVASNSNNNNSNNNNNRDSSKLEVNRNSDKMASQGGLPRPSGGQHHVSASVGSGSYGTGAVALNGGGGLPKPQMTHQGASEGANVPPPLPNRPQTMSNLGNKSLSPRVTTTGLSVIKNKKSLAMMGIQMDNEAELPDEVKQQGLVHPQELHDTKAWDYTIPDIYKFHLPSAEILEKRENAVALSKQKKNEQVFYQLVFDIKHCIFKAGNDTFLLFSIYDDKSQQYVTEEYCLNLSVNNFPKKGSPEECKVLFENLTENHLRSDLFIIAKIYRHGPMEQPNVMSSGNDKKQKGGSKVPSVLRPYGITVIRLKDHMHQLLSQLGKEVSFEAGTAPIHCPKEDGGFVNLPNDLIQLRKNTSFVAPMCIGIAHSFTLYRGGVDVVAKEYKEFDALTSVERLDIDPAIDSDRHMLYVTISETHVDQRRKRAQCNVMCKVELRDNMTCKALPGRMMMGRGEMAVPEEARETPVFYHNNDPVINQTYCVLIPEDIKKLEGCHLYFTMWHQPKDKPPDERGFAFLKLYHDNLKQLTNNKTYELPIYRELNRKEKINYLDNPTQLKTENKVVRIYFNLQSTKILPDNDIHQFLTWRHQPVEPVAVAVRRVAKKPFNQLLIILDDLMKTIFEIMMESQDKSLIEQTFAALVGVFGEVNKGINEKYRDRIETWIKNRFRYPKIWRSVSYQMLTLLQWIASETAVKELSKDADATMRQRGAEHLRQLQHCMRGIRYVFQIMKRSCQLEVEDNPDAKDKILKDYDNQVTQLFASLNKMMGLSHQQVAGVQSYAIRNFLSLLDSLPNQANSSAKLVSKVEEFVNAIQNTGVLNNVEKLLLIRRFLEHPNLERKEIFGSFFPKLFKLLHFHVNGSIDEKLACFTIVQKCVNIMDPHRPRRIKDPTDEAAPPTYINDGDGLQLPAEMMNEFASMMLKFFSVFEEIRTTDLSTVTNVQRIFGRSFKKNPGMRTARERAVSVAEMSGVSQEQLDVHRDFCVTLADLARQVTGRGTALKSWGEKSDRVDTVVAQLRKESEEEAIDMIEKVLRCCNSLLRHTVFPSPWVFMRMVEAELAMRGLSWFASTLQKNYLRKYFKKDLWQEWLRLGMTFLSNDDFALEDIDGDKADIITTHFGDVRGLAIEKITAAWDVLTPHRSQLADTMISAAVEASASEVSEIQEFAVDVYFQMMKSEFELTNAVKTVETFTIDQVDELTAKYSTKETIINRYLDFFRVHIRKKLDGSSSKLRKMGDEFLSEIEKLYSYLVKLKKLPSEAQYEDERTTATLSLLNYLQLTNKNELYNRYIHHLALMHQQLNNHIEAGNCFKHHADRLGWSERVLKEEPQIGLEERAEWDRHVKLSNLAHKHYMLGEAWEMGVRVCQELAHIYETKLFDLKSLSSTLEKQSQLWKFIAGQDRVFHSCYLVSFRGNFPDGLRNEQYIYRSGNGKFPEPVRDFTGRIKAKWPEATVQNSSDPIPDQYEDPSFDGQYIRITTLSPSSSDEAEGGIFKWDDTKAPLRLKKYYRENETDTFCYTFQKKMPKPKKGENEFRNLWITKIFITAEESIPSLRRRIPVIKEKKIEYTPLQTAINNLVDKNRGLLKIIETCENDVQHNTNDLSMNLNGVLDAAVMGGVAKYREAFFDGQYLSQFPTEVEITGSFKQALKEQMEVAEQGLIAYEKYCNENLRPHAEHLRTCMSKMQKDLRDFLSS